MIFFKEKEKDGEKRGKCKYSEEKTPSYSNFEFSMNQNITWLFIILQKMEAPG